MIKKHHLQDHIPQQQLRLLYYNVLFIKSRCLFFKKKFKITEYNEKISHMDDLNISHFWPNMHLKLTLSMYSHLIDLARKLLHTETNDQVCFT